MQEQVSRNIPMCFKFTSAYQLCPKQYVISVVCWSPKDQESTAELQSASEIKYIFFPEA